jgi:hypothetical protein
MKLIYRGYIYDYTPAPLPPYRPPRALNWRYQLRGKQYECKPDEIRPYRQPRAFNWRYQLLPDI